MDSPIYHSKCHPFFYSHCDQFTPSPTRHYPSYSSPPTLLHDRTNVHTRQPWHARGSGSCARPQTSGASSPSSPTAFLAASRTPPAAQRFGRPVQGGDSGSRHRRRRAGGHGPGAHARRGVPATAAPRDAGGVPESDFGRATASSQGVAGSCSGLTDEPRPGDGGLAAERWLGDGRLDNARRDVRKKKDMTGGDRVKLVTMAR
ncbi:hypothetical protein PVAP13_2KG403010 [Panicum virgatum]|uniref:Uncharacterized protein n=1 Tax=Panicum virgatum TaxID=38727 RepID=A0A8T0WHG1_PANVG|nr:hypothetical protein PVAP13_2KG403010 [Panicum virgatum]